MMTFTLTLISLRFSHSRGRQMGAAALTCVLTAGLYAAPAFPATGGGVCSPPALGSPCATGGTAVMGNSEPLPGLGLGNPVHLASGNKYQLDVDLPPNPAAPGLELVRHYNGLSTRNGTLGRNWALSYDSRLLYRQGHWQIQQADGSTRQIDSPVPTPQGYSWNWPNGEQLQFDTQGHLVGIRRGRNTRVRINRYPGPHALAGLIQRIDSAGGPALIFHYENKHGQALLSAVDTPLGRFHYHYGTPGPDALHTTPRLQAVQRPDGMERHYHYEAAHQSGNPYALTGISVALGGGTLHRLNSWAYDLHGRVVSLQRHGQSTPRLQVEYVQGARPGRPGLTRVFSDTGNQGSIHYQRLGREYRLLQRHSDGQESTKAPLDYDGAGRLQQLNALEILRSPQGALAAVRPRAPGWPGLVLENAAVAGRHAWSSLATGQTRLTADALGRPTVLEYANGDTLQVRHDAQGRPITLEHTSPAHGPSEITRLTWRGHQLQRIDHPHETETRHYDAAGRVSERVLTRPALFAAPAAHFRERFLYSKQGQLLRHELPEGGALLYEWGKEATTSKLAALRWEDAQGQTRTIMESVAGQPGYRYGNGLEMLSSARHGPQADTLELSHRGQTIWRQHRHYDKSGQLQQDSHEFPLAGHHDALNFEHDTQSRLQAAYHPPSQTRWWYAWHSNGAQAALNINQQTEIPHIQRDPSGLPLAFGNYRLQYSPSRRLQTVSTTGSSSPLAQYRHNAFGHRIALHTKNGVKHHIYLHDQLVAEASSTGQQAPRITRRYLYAGLTPVGVIDYPQLGPPQLYAVHADLSGAPRLVTDSQGQLRWLAHYSPTGQARRVAGDLEFKLRLPGQYADKETGWHDNLLRTYVPELGHYLEPDPLGPLPGSDTFGYARQQPWRYADPHGLILFAFDGTRYSADSMSNAWILAQAYREGPAHYHSGPGTRLFLDWDAITAWQAGQILENQWQALLTSLAQQPAGAVVPVDIIGFSRGAALARHFGNRIVSHTQNGLFSVDDPLRGRVSACVDLRFMGLFDTVSQFGVSGSHNHLYDFSVAELWSWVSHAVALHEHRWTFPLTSADAGGAGNVVEAPFLGAHADIGGGVAMLEPGSPEDTEAASSEQNSDLAKVALAWMHWQALAASVDFAELSADDITLQAPLLRDMRSPLARSLQAGDRTLFAPSSHKRFTYQDEDPRLGREARAQLEAFISRPEGWRTQGGKVVGTVDMEGYSRWLEDTLGWSPP